VDLWAFALAEHRGEFGAVLAAAGLPAPRHGTATSFAEARAVAAEIGYPVLVRPSYVLGGRGMEIVYDDATLESYVSRATQASQAPLGQTRTGWPLIVSCAWPVPVDPKRKLESRASTTASGPG